jgi:quinol monooxygenase YgiN
MIHATIRIVTSPENHDEAFAILYSMAQHIRVESGCIACRVYQNAHEDRALLFEEIWKSEEDLNRHIRSDEYRHVLLVVEMAVEKPEIRFETVSHVTGMETIEKVRAGSIINT